MAQSDPGCLHCDINDVVRAHIEEIETINLPALISMMGESLVDLILLGPKEEWGNLLAEAMSEVGHLFLEKMGGVDTTTAH